MEIAVDLEPIGPQNLKLCRKVIFTAYEKAVESASACLYICTIWLYVMHWLFLQIRMKLSKREFDSAIGRHLLQL